MDGRPDPHRLRARAGVKPTLALFDVLGLPGAWASRNPMRAALVLSLIMLGALALLPQLRFDDNVVRTLSSDSAVSRDYRALSEDLSGAEQDILVLAEHPAGFSADAYRQMRDLALELELTDRVNYVLSPFALRFPPDHEAYPGEPMVPEPIDPDTLEPRIAAFSELTGALPPLISPDRTALLMAVAIDLPHGSPDTRSLLSTIGALTDAFGAPGLAYTIAGEPAMAVDIVEALRVDLIRLNLVGGLLGVLMCWVIFGDLRVAALTAAPAAAGLLVTLGIFAATGLPITVITNVVPVLVLVLGLADSVHLVMHLLEDAPATAPTPRRIADTARRVGPACGLTAITTAVAFAAIAIADSEPLRELALLGALSTLSAYLVVLVGFALVARFMPAGAAARLARRRTVGVPPLFGRLVFNHGRIVIATGMVIGLAAAFAVSLTEPWFTYRGNLAQDSAVYRASNVIERDFGGFFRAWVDFDLDAEGGWTTGQGWDRLVAATERLQAENPQLAVISLATLAAQLGVSGGPPAPDELADVPAALLRQLASEDAQTARVMVPMGDPMRDEATLARFDRFEQSARASGAARVSGLPVLMRHEPLDIIRQLSIGLVMACLASVVLVAAALGWPMLSIALTLPNLLPLAVAGAALHLIDGGRMIPTAALALTVAFGIAVDDSIHFVSRFDRERRDGQPVDAALRRTLEGTGRAMIATTLLLCVGLLVVYLSAFATVRLFGTMLILTFITALLADLVFLPALLRQRWFRR
jgi:predicted RND superfamily exporter protein